MQGAGSGGAGGVSGTAAGFASGAAAPFSAAAGFGSGKADRHGIVRGRQLHLQRRNDRPRARQRAAGCIEHQLARRFPAGRQFRRRQPLDRDVLRSARTVHQRKAIAVDAIGEGPQPEVIACPRSAAPRRRRSDRRPDRRRRGRANGSGCGGFRSCRRCERRPSATFRGHSTALAITANFSRVTSWSSEKVRPFARWNGARPGR